MSSRHPHPVLHACPLLSVLLLGVAAGCGEATIDEPVDRDVGTTTADGGPPVQDDAAVDGGAVTPPADPIAGCPELVVEVESATLSGYRVEDPPVADGASGDANVTLYGGSEGVWADQGSAELTLRWDGSCTYDVLVGYYDERDGRSRVEVSVDGAPLDSWVLSADTQAWEERQVASALSLGPTATFSLRGFKDEGEFARFDYLALRPSDACADGGEPCGGAGEVLPAPLRVVRVSNSPELAAALEEAAPGDHIVLADGAYDGFTVSRSGLEDTPIVIRAENTLQADIDGAIVVEGDDVWIVGIDLTIASGESFPNESSGIEIHGSRDRISSSRFRVHGVAINVERDSRSVIVDHNEIVSESSDETVAWDGIRLVYTTNGYRHHVYRNYLRDAPMVSGNRNNRAIGIGVNGNYWYCEGESIVEYNLVENWYGDTEVVTTKSSANIIRFNTMIGGLEFNTRVGNHNQWIANWLEDSRRIRLHGKYHTVIGNRAPEIGVYAGDGDVRSDEVSYVTTEDTLVVGNTGTLVVGATLSGRPNHPSKNTRVEAHDGAIRYGNHVGTTVSETTTRDIPTAIRLSRTEVGPFAPTAPTPAP